MNSLVDELIHDGIGDGIYIDSTLLWFVCKLRFSRHRYLKMKVICVLELDNSIWMTSAMELNNYHIIEYALDNTLELNQS